MSGALCDLRTTPPVGVDILGPCGSQKSRWCGSIKSPRPPTTTGGCVKQGMSTKGSTYTFAYVTLIRSIPSPPMVKPNAGWTVRVRCEHHTAMGKVALISYWRHSGTRGGGVQKAYRLCCYVAIIALLGT